LKRSGFLLATVSTIGSLVAAFVSYSTRVSPGESPKWLVDWAIANRATTAAILLGITALIAVCDWFRVYLTARHEQRTVLQKILTDYSKRLFEDRTRQNRLSLFKKTIGWRVWFWSLVRLKLEKSHKWSALLRVKFREPYLGVYLRPIGVRNQVSCAAFRVSDDSEECEGVVGLVWEKGQVLLTNLPKMDRSEIRGLRTLEGLPADAPLSQYAKATNVRDIRVLHSCDHFARHFVGSLIRKSDGTSWGVLLLDSEDDECLFATNGEPNALHVQRFGDCAAIIGKIVE
jgi:hypothetical protein